METFAEDLSLALEPVYRASKDIAKAIRSGGGGITEGEARFLVDMHENVQRQRIRCSNAVKQLGRDAETSGVDEEPHDALDYIRKQHEIIEKQIATLVGAVFEVHEMAWFFQQTPGIGPGLAMKLLAELDINRAPTAGHFWSFAGLNPAQSWGKGQKRPFNARLKKTLFLCSDQWIKMKANPDSHYSRWLFERRDIEWQKNLEGGNVDYCRKALDRKQYGDSTDAKAWLEGKCSPGLASDMLAEGDTPTAAKCRVSEGGLPMIPPAQVVMRARRWTSKLFLAHLHHCWYEQAFGVEPPKPYVIEHGGHAHTIVPFQVRNKGVIH